MKITKLPNKIDPNKMIEEEIDKNNSICPMCGEHAEYQFDRLYGGGSGIERVPITTSWYGKQYEDERPLEAFKFWKENHHWKRNHYECHTCGCKWMSDAFPTDIYNPDYKPKKQNDWYDISVWCAIITAMIMLCAVLGKVCGLYG